MKTFLIIIAVLAVIGAGIWIGTKYFGLFTDKDKDGIPDEVEVMPIYREVTLPMEMLPLYSSA